MNIKGGGADTLKFNLHIVECVKKGCEFNQKRCEFKKFPIIIIIIIIT
jgi:fumarate reductase subunit C